MANPKALAPRDLARHAIELARRAGAQHAAAAAHRSRRVSVEWRDGRIENVTEATQRALSIDLYVDGRYSSVWSSDLRPDALAAFVAGSVALARALAVDPDRVLPDPELYAYDGPTAQELDLEDPSQGEVTAESRKQLAAAIEAAARAVPGAAAILSVSTGVVDGWSELEQVASNGFEGTARTTSFSASVQVTVDDGARRPAEWSATAARHRADLRDGEEIGREAGERALRRRGAAKGPSAVLPVIVENRAAGRLVSMLLGPLGGSTLQQKRSFLEGKLGERIADARMTLTDQPFIPRGLGSRRFDAEGIAARPRAIIEAGVLRTYFLDTYYARKLAMPPTSGNTSNLVWSGGARGLAELVAGAGDALLVTAFLGGNSNPATGDFSLGVQGYRVAGGQIAEPVGEMNLAGNHADLWNRLAAVGDDPYPSSSMRTPTLAFDGLQIAGM